LAHHTQGEPCVLVQEREVLAGGRGDEPRKRLAPQTEEADPAAPLGVAILILEDDFHLLAEGAAEILREEAQQQPVEPRAPGVVIVAHRAAALHARTPRCLTERLRRPGRARATCRTGPCARASRSSR